MSISIGGISCIVSVVAGLAFDRIAQLITSVEAFTEITPPTYTPILFAVSLPATFFLIIAGILGLISRGRARQRFCIKCAAKIEGEAIVCSRFGTLNEVIKNE